MNILTEMMSYQGDVRVMLMRRGVPEQWAGELARDIADKIFTSALVTERVREIYNGGKQVKT